MNTQQQSHTSTSERKHREGMSVRQPDVSFTDMQHGNRMPSPSYFTAPGASTPVSDGE